MIYPVSEIFVSLQGEGHFVGYPMAFVRLAGCSVVSCSIRKDCDEAPWKAKHSLRVRDIVDNIKAQGFHSGIVCISGGEPTDHDLLPLVVMLRNEGYRVHLETSGVRSVEGLPLDWITVSPKTSDYKQRQGHTLKIVVRPEWGDVARAWEFIAGISDCTNFFHRYLQPLWRDGAAVNLLQVIEMLTSGYRNAGGIWALSTQAHKTWGVR